MWFFAAIRNLDLIDPAAAGGNLNIQGSCHCGNIRFALEWPEDALPIPARACDCSFCTKHGGVWTSHPAAELDVQIADRSRVSNYTFSTQTAEFLICASCGVVPVVTCELDGNRYAVVNTSAFEGVDAESLARSEASFGGEGLESRLERRRLRWIPKVRLDFER